MPRRDDVDLAALRHLIRRLFGTDCKFARTETGVSTPVYRVRRRDDVFYLRLAETPEASLAPEVEVHTRLRELGVRVPAIVFFEPWDTALRRSTMVTTEIPGESLAHGAAMDMPEVAREAGRDLAVINSLPVAGFGWIRRDNRTPSGLYAEYPASKNWIREHLDNDLALLVPELLTADEATHARLLIEQVAVASPETAGRLAHGDFDVSHIFQQRGRYTGIIDFGEIRGGDPLYDLAHFRLHDREKAAQPLFAHLLAGYREVEQLPGDWLPRIRALSLLIGIRALARILSRPSTDYQRHLVGTIRTLLSEADL